MSLVIRFSLITLPMAFFTYKGACFKFILKKGNQRMRKGDARYDEILRTLPGGHIKAAMQPFLDQSGIRKDLIIIEQSNLGFCCASGTNAFTKGDAAIVIAPGFYEVDKDACSWVAKHEISHIKYNDCFTVWCVPLICQIAAIILGMRFLSSRFVPLLAWAVCCVSYTLFSQWREAKADDFAIENSSDEELKGGMRFLIAMQEINIEKRNTFWKRITISASGNERLGITHPSYISRIQKIEKVLHARNVVEEKPKLEVEFKAYMVNANLKMEQAFEKAGGHFGMLRQTFSC